MNNIDIFPIKIHVGYPADRGLVDSVLDNVDMQKQVQPAIDGWLCDVQTGHYMTDKERDLSWVDEFCYGIQHNINMYINEMIGTNETFGYKFGTPWVNVYERGNHQEHHSHVGLGMAVSYCYFYKLPDKQGCASFKMRNPNYMYNFFGQDNGNWFIKTAEMHYTPEIKEGQIVIFPCWLEHVVTPHKIDDERITVAGNIILQGAQ